MSNLSIVVANCNIDMESLYISPKLHYCNPTIGTITLLKPGSESSLDRLEKQITNSIMSDIEAEFKIDVVVEAISVCASSFLKNIASG